MASKSKNIAELLNGDVTIDESDIADGSITGAKFSESFAAGGFYTGNNDERGEVFSGKDDIFRVHTSTLSTDVTIDAGNNAICSGPLEIADGTTLTIDGNLTIA